MNTTERVLLVLLGITACLVVGVASLMGAQAYQLWASEPLGPVLHAPTLGWSLPPTWTPSPGPGLNSPPGTPPPVPAHLIEATAAALAAPPLLLSMLLAAARLQS
jgi:hypothetical protein